MELLKKILKTLLPRRYYLKIIRKAIKKKFISINALPFEECLSLFQLGYINLYDITNDTFFTRIMYKIRTKQTLNLEDPKTLNEKINWLKLYYRKPEYTAYTDKYRVREYIKTIIGEQYLIPLLRVYHDISDFIVEKLPPAPFIIKPNHDCGGGIIVRDKKKIDFGKVKELLTNRLKQNYYYLGREYTYKNIKRCILLEKLLLTKEKKIPYDYKFHCFHGKIEFVYCSIDREDKNYRKVYTKDWKKTNMVWAKLGDEKKFLGPDILKPQNYQKMIEIVEKLASQFLYIRVDLYNLEGEIYFGELTFYQGCGFEVITPKKMDYYYGSLIKLPSKII